MADIEELGFRVWTGKADRMRDAHLHNEIELNYAYEGTVSYLFSGGVGQIAPRRLAIFWASMPHQLVRLKGGGRMWWATVPLAWFLQWQLPKSFSNAVLHGRLVVESRENPLDEQLLSRWPRDISRGRQWERIVALELEARVRRMALSSTGHAQSKTALSLDEATHGSGGKVEAMARFVAQRYTTHLCIQDVSQSVGLHPNYAMALFRRQCGMSLMDYLARHRVSHAQRLLITTNRKMLDVALDAGFGSLSRFYARFTQSCGKTPRQYRAAMRKGN